MYSIRVSASAAGTSGVVYGVKTVNYGPVTCQHLCTRQPCCQGKPVWVFCCASMVRAFSIHGAYRCSRRHLYSDMNLLAAQAPISSAGISILPLERCGAYAGEQEIGCSIHGINLQPARQTAYHPCSTGRHRFSFKWNRHHGTNGLPVPVMQARLICSSTTVPRDGSQ